MKTLNLIQGGEKLIEYITYPNIGMRFKGDLLLNLNLNLDYEYKCYEVNNCFNLRNNMDCFFRFSVVGKACNDVYFVISNMEIKESGGDLYDLFQKDYLLYNASEQLYYFNGDLLDITTIEFPNIHKDDGEIFFRVTVDGDVISGKNEKKSDFICNINFDKYIYIGFITGIGNGEEYEYKFISNNY